MHRLFVGFRPPPHIRDRALALAGGVPGARWQQDDQLHVTLRFIGEVPQPLAEDVAIALSAIRFASFSGALVGLGRFEHRGRLHTLWAGARPRELLTALHRKIDQALVRCGLPPERRAYLPHLTLARLHFASLEATERFLRTHVDFATSEFVIDHFLLLESRLGREGARYEPVERYPCGGQT